MNQKLPTPGTAYTKNGRTFTVQFIENGEVYGVMYREGFTYSDNWDDDGCPEGYIGNYRISISEFWKAIKGAKTQ